PSSSRISAAWRMVSQSDLEPMMIPTTGPRRRAPGRRLDAFAVLAIAAWCPPRKRRTLYDRASEGKPEGRRGTVLVTFRKRLRPRLRACFQDPSMAMTGAMAFGDG